MDQLKKLQKIVGKINILIEKIDWTKRELRSNEIDIAHQNFRKALRELEEAAFWREGGQR